MARFIDTNVFVACLRGRAAHVRDRFLQHPPGEILVPFQVLAELKLGAAKSARPEHHARQVANILQPFAVAWPDSAAVEHYVDIRIHHRSHPPLRLCAFARVTLPILLVFDAIKHLIATPSPQVKELGFHTLASAHAAKKPSRGSKP